MNTPNTQTQPADDYTAVVYVHGMGKQRRYEEVSRMIDVLDKYARDSVSKNTNGLLKRIRARLEPNQNPDLSDRPYVRVAHKIEDGLGQLTYKSYRFHEIYWAPLTAGVATSWGVLKWMLRQALTPFQTLFFSPWRSRLRLRSAALFDLREIEADSKDYNYQDYSKLVTMFNDFEGIKARKRYPDGLFADFLKFIKSRCHNKPDTTKRLTELARQWKRHYVRIELMNLAVVLSLILAILLAVGGVFGLTLMALTWLSDNTSISILIGSLPSGVLEYFAPTVSNAMTTTVVLLTMLGVTRFLREYMGDVQLWTTYEETQTKHKIREEILRRSIDVMSHVLLDPDCTRVVILSHSLGTTIALDSLLELGKINRARNLQNPMTGKYDLEKIDHFITMGSPIDKVHYFFESHKGKYHRYNRVVEEIRGDMGFPPFCKNGGPWVHPWVHWINFWDTADIISGRLNSPASRTRSHIRIDNFHVRTYRMPSPGKSHHGYFYNNIVVKHLFDVIFKQAYSFTQAPMLANNRPDYESQYIGSGQETGRVRLLQFGFLLLPWILLAYLLNRFLSS